MKLSQALFMIAGTVVLSSLLLTYFYSAYWLWLTAFVGFNMLFYSTTGFCPMASFLKYVGFKD